MRKISKNLFAKISGLKRFSSQSKTIRALVNIVLLRPVFVYGYAASLMARKLGIRNCGASLNSSQASYFHIHANIFQVYYPTARRVKKICSQFKICFSLK